MNLHLSTLKWLDNELNRIHNDSIKYGELLLTASDHNSTDLYNQKLKQLEKEHQVITRKIWKEKDMIE